MTSALSQLLDALPPPTLAASPSQSSDKAEGFAAAQEEASPQQSEFEVLAADVGATSDDELYY